MSRIYFTSLLLLISIFSSGNAKSIVDCRVVTGGTTECNPFGSKLMHLKEVHYNTDRKKLIVSKTLPVPQKTKIKVISVEDMIEKYVKVEDPLRFKRVYTQPLNMTVENKSVERQIIRKAIKHIAKKEKKKEIEINKTVKTNTSSIRKVSMEKTEIKKVKEKVYGIYKVVSGDVLGRIASKFGLSIKELLRLNNFDKKQTLKLGQEFKVPFSQKMVDAIVAAEYHIESGDTLLSIAHKFKLESKTLAKFNQIKPSAILRVGKKLRLPLPHILKKIESEKKILLAKKLALEKKQRKKREEAKKRQKIAQKNKKIKFIRGFGKRKLRVTATAYSSHKNQTDDTPFLAAWNNRLRPGMKVIAVSRDMLTRYGMRNGTKVRIGGLKGYYTVRDKMNKRYRKRIDIYMGVDRRRALRWGRRSVAIYW